jgi:hemoglobin
MRRSIGLAMLLLVLTVTVGACASTREPTPAPMPSLYKRLGGREGISGVVNDFAANMLADARVNERFKDKKPAELDQFKSKLADQICEASGGPCSYYGKDMKSAHAGMRISEVEWNATVENLVRALDKNNIDARSKQELLGMLAPMKKDIVGQ